MQYRLFTLLISLLFMAGCVDSLPKTTEKLTVPEYVVLITTDNPFTQQSSCTGIALNVNQVLTNYHCVQNTNRNPLARILTQYGQETYFTIEKYDSELDLAILNPLFPIFLFEYASFGNADLERNAYLYGNCPYYMLSMGRKLSYSGEETVEVYEIDGDYKNSYVVEYQAWKAEQSNYMCGGDSGGILLQNGKIIGVMFAVETEVIFYNVGTVGAIVSSDRVLDFIHGEGYYD